MERVQARRAFIGADWVEDEDEDEGAKSVRFLDYACGTGMLSRVRFRSSSHSSLFVAKGLVEGGVGC